MSRPFIARFQYLFAQPRSQAVVSLDGLLRYTHRHEIAVEEPGHAAEPFAEQSSESPTAAVGGCVEAGRVPREGPARD
jgi:hypothetical protein